MKFSEYLAIKTIAIGYEGKKCILPVSLWTCGFSKKAIPSGCIELKKGEKAPFVKNSLISQSDIENFFQNFPRTRKIIVFIENQDFLDNLENKKWELSLNKIKSYAYFLLYEKGDKEITISFIKSVQKYFSFEEYFLLKDIGMEIPSNSNLKIKEFDFNDSPFIIKTTKISKSNKVLVRDFKDFTNCIKKKEFEKANNLFEKSLFVEKFIEHKSFEQFIDTLEKLDKQDTIEVFNMISSKIPFITDKYNLFTSVFYFNPFNFTFDKENGKIMVDKLPTVLNNLKDKDKKIFFKLYEDYIGTNDIENEYISKSFLNLYKDFFEYTSNLSRFRMSDKTTPLKNDTTKIKVASFKNSYIKLIFSKNLNITIEKEIRDLMLSSMEIKTIKATDNNNITDLTLKNVYVEEGILDLSDFPKLKRLSIENSDNIKKIILNKNIDFLNFYSDNEELKKTFDLKNFNYLRVNGKEEYIGEKAKEVIKYFEENIEKDTFHIEELYIYCWDEEKAQNFIDRSYNILGKSSENYEENSANSIKYYSFEDILKVIKN